MSTFFDFSNGTEFFFVIFFLSTNFGLDNP